MPAKQYYNIPTTLIFQHQILISAAIPKKHIVAHIMILGYFDQYLVHFLVKVHKVPLLWIAKY